MVETIVTNSVKVSLRLDTTVDDFYKNDMASSFIDKMTAFLGISMDRIRIVGVRAGSVIVDFTIDAAESSDVQSSSAAT